MVTAVVVTFAIAGVLRLSTRSSNVASRGTSPRGVSNPIAFKSATVLGSRSGMGALGIQCAATNPPTMAPPTKSRFHDSFFQS